jgi:branched-chain amino acid aminotransferase
LRGVIRKNILKIAAKNGFEVEERDFSPFEIQRADEMFLTNSVSGIRWVEYFKKKKFGVERTRELFETLNQALN